MKKYMDICTVALSNKFTAYVRNIDETKKWERI